MRSSGTVGQILEGIESSLPLTLTFHCFSLNRDDLSWEQRNCQASSGPRSVPHLRQGSEQGARTPWGQFWNNLPGGEVFFLLLLGQRLARGLMQADHCIIRAGVDSFPCWFGMLQVPCSSVTRERPEPHQICLFSPIRYSICLCPVSSCSSPPIEFSKLVPFLCPCGNLFLPLLSVLSLFQQWFSLRRDIPRIHVRLPC